MDNITQRVRERYQYEPIKKTKDGEIMLCYDLVTTSYCVVFFVVIDGVKLLQNLEKKPLRFDDLVRAEREFERQKRLIDG